MQSTDVADLGYMQNAAVQQSLQGVLKHLSVRDVCALSCTSRTWRGIVLTAPGLWQLLAARHFQHPHPVHQSSRETQRADFLKWHSLHQAVRSQSPVRVVEDLARLPAEHFGLSPDMRHLAASTDESHPIAGRPCTWGHSIYSVSPSQLPLYQSQQRQYQSKQLQRLLSWSPDSTKALFRTQMMEYCLVDMRLPGGATEIWQWAAGCGSNPVESCWAADSSCVLLVEVKFYPPELTLRFGLLHCAEERVSFQLSDWQPVARPATPATCTLDASQLAEHLCTCSGTVHCTLGQELHAPCAALPSAVGHGPHPEQQPSSSLDCPHLLGWLHSGGPWQQRAPAAVRHPGLMASEDMERFGMTEAFSADNAFRVASTLEGTVCLQDHGSLQILHTWGDQVHGSRTSQMHTEEPGWIRRRFSQPRWSSDGWRLMYMVGDQMHVLIWR